MLIIIFIHVDNVYVVRPSYLDSVFEMSGCMLCY